MLVGGGDVKKNELLSPGFLAFLLIQITKEKFYFVFYFCLSRRFSVPPIWVPGAVRRVRQGCCATPGTLFKGGNWS